LGQLLTNDDDFEQSVVTRRARRAVSDEILIAFHYACDLRDFDIAKKLLATFETAIGTQENTPGFNRKRALDALLAAHERLWTLTHEDVGAISALGIARTTAY